MNDDGGVTVYLPSNLNPANFTLAWLSESDINCDEYSEADERIRAGAETRVAIPRGLPWEERWLVLTNRKNSNNDSHSIKHILGYLPANHWKLKIQNASPAVCLWHRFGIITNVDAKQICGRLKFIKDFAPNRGEIFRQMVESHNQLAANHDFNSAFIGEVWAWRGYFQKRCRDGLDKIKATLALMLEKGANWLLDEDWYGHARRWTEYYNPDVDVSSICSFFSRRDLSVATWQNDQNLNAVRTDVKGLQLGFPSDQLEDNWCDVSYISDFRRRDFRGIELNDVRPTTAQYHIRIHDAEAYKAFVRGSMAFDFEPGRDSTFLDSIQPIFERALREASGLIGSPIDDGLATMLMFDDEVFRTNFGQDRAIVFEAATLCRLHVWVKKNENRFLLIDNAEMKTLCDACKNIFSEPYFWGMFNFDSVRVDGFITQFHV
jgi:hypothetical protein